MNNENYQKRHPKFSAALFGALFKMFGWLKFRRLLERFLKTTKDDDRVPTDDKLDAAIEHLAFYMDYIWPLINFIIKEKTINFFRYKLRRFLFKVLLFCVVIGAGIGFYKLYHLYIQKPKVVYVEKKKEYLNGVVINTDTIFIPAERSALTKDNLDYFASEMGIKHWYYVRNQIITETGFTSESCTKANNLFGMKLPGQRETTAVGEMFGHAKYKHWVYSLYDYKLWQDLIMESIPMKKGESYPNWLSRVGYAEAEAYSQVLRTVNWYQFKSNAY